ncbi:methyltransferase domain-containing protein [Nocardiopsis coralliicola]
MTEYMFDSATDLGKEQLTLLEELYDPPTVAALEAAQVGPGATCLDLGAGGGSISRWLARRVGPSGRVIAADLVLDHLAPGPDVEVRQHDIGDGVPAGGPFDLIHARLLLMHLGRREEIVRQLVAALAPGGRLVIGEVSGLGEVVAAPTGDDAALFARVRDTARSVAGAQVALDFDWVYRAEACMREAGLTDLYSASYSATLGGGNSPARLAWNYFAQAIPLVRAAGVTDEELARFRALLHSPEFRAWFFEYRTIRGRRP